VTATRPAEEFPMSRQAIVKHLAALSDAGLVSTEKVGREQRYRLEPTALEPALLWIAEVGAAWDERLVALKRLLDRPDQDRPDQDRPAP
jgi:DNA-binding transcriptional ArsR family regulator